MTISTKNDYNQDFLTDFVNASRCNAVIDMKDAIQSICSSASQILW